MARTEKLSYKDVVAIQAQELHEFISSPEQRLAASVLQRAVRDLGKGGRERDRSGALEFFYDSSHEVYSLNWICETLGLDRGVLLDALDGAIRYGVLPEGIENTKR